MVAAAPAHRAGFTNSCRVLSRQARARHVCRRRNADGEEQQDHHRGDNAQDTAVIFKRPVK